MSVCSLFKPRTRTNGQLTGVDFCLCGAFIVYARVVDDTVLCLLLLLLLWRGCSSVGDDGDCGGVVVVGGVVSSVYFQHLNEGEE